MADELGDFVVQVVKLLVCLGMSVAVPSGDLVSDPRPDNGKDEGQA